jgi:protein-disulfide isomerase
MTLGAADAPVTIIEYASFTCPHCARFHETVFGDLVKEYVDTGKVRFIMRDVYFDRFGLWAAMLARCETDKFFAVSDLLYAQQSDWTKADSNEKIVENLYGIGRASGLADEAIGTCLQDNDKAQALVAAYQTNAEQDGIDSTPSFLINGKKYPNMSLEDFRKLLDELLAE